MPYRTIKPEDLIPSERHHYLLGSVNPRPICFASTIDKNGKLKTILHRRLQAYLDSGQIKNAWELILAAEQSGEYL